MTSKIIIGRAAGRVSINGMEYLLDEDGQEMIFDSERAAREYLREHGIPESEIEEMSFIQVEGPRETVNDRWRGYIMDRFERQM